ncbi:hypothetical protein [Campylobacter sp. MG1]|uniref:hypothetical protein n=1 Tax=Campylobacter sp. MG1 TaxID=2976332 RepID=UPI00226C8AE6|nr:hypothetical protein [Campylobacter sp. MG1]
MNKDMHIKLLLWSILSITSIFILCFTLIIPVSNNYINYNYELKSLLINKKNNKNELKILNDEINKQKNDLNLNKIKNSFNIDKLKTYCEQFFNNIDIKQIKTNKDYDIYQLNMNTKVNSPKMFYNFIDKLNSVDNIIKIHLPIIMESNKETIKIKFNILIYKT